MTALNLTRLNSLSRSQTVQAKASARSDATSAKPNLLLQTPSVLVSLSDTATKSNADAFSQLTSTLSPDQAKALNDKKGKADELLQQFETLRQSNISDRKGNARQKLEQAKAKLQLLRQLGGDPKTIARQAKQIAQEIREAAKEYSSAVESDSGSASSATTTATETQGAGSQTSEGGSANKVETAAGQAEATAGKTEAGTAADATTPETSAKASDTSSQKPEIDGKTEAKAGEAQPSAREAAAKAYKDLADKSDAAFAKNNADRDVVEQFKDAARQVKALLEEAARKLKQQKSNDGDADEAKKAGEAMDKAVDHLSSVVDSATAEAQSPEAALSGGVQFAPVINLLA